MPVVPLPSMNESHRIIERLRGQFEALLEQDGQADLGSALADDGVRQLDVHQRRSLFRELLRIEIGHRRHRGLLVDPADYERRFEGYRDVIHELFPAVASPNETIDDEGATVGIEAASQEACPVTLASRFTNLRFHARGGLGEVFRAHDETLRRDVAVKFIRPARADEPASREQFLLEGEITGRLDHPGIVPVYGLGETFDNRVFLAMRFIDGKTFREVIDEYHKNSAAGPSERRRELNRLLHHLVATCNVVAYAHSRGILHRDIKPENVMIGRFNETLVVDWGLAVPIKRDEKARASGEQTIHVASGSGDSRNQQAAGTIGYLSPESFDNQGFACDSRSDVYSLGGMLYYLLTGCRSVTGGATSETLSTIRTGSFPAPRKLDRSIPRPLDAICAKAMAVAPSYRYASPLEMAADIESFIEDEPVSVLRESLFERCRRTARHHRGIVLSVTAGLVSVAVVACLAGVWLKQQANSEQQARIVAEQAEREGVRLAATFAAQTVAGEIDVRWRILEALAAEPELRKILGEIPNDADDAAAEQQSELQRWLLEHIQDYDSIGADSWFVMSAAGKQLARRPFEKKTIGHSYATRDYFHGQGRELEDGASAEPIRGPHLSRAYESSSDGSLKIAYSVPIWPLTKDTAGQRPIGVLAMTAKAGEFRILHRGLSRGQVAVLADIRGGENADDPQGLVLHHPDLPRLRKEKIGAGETPEPSFLQRDVVDRLARLLRFSRAGEEFETEVEADYIDHLWADPSARWLASFEPVVIANRSRENPEQRYPGLVVIVQLCKTPMAAGKPSAAEQNRSALP